MWNDSENVKIPIILGEKFCYNIDSLNVDPTKCLRLVGKFIYLHIIEPNSAYAIGVISQFIKLQNKFIWKYS